MTQTNYTNLESFCAALAPIFLSYLKRKSISAATMETAATLDGVASLPAIQEDDDGVKYVKVPLSLLAVDTTDFETRLAALEEAVAAIKSCECDSSEE